MKTLCLSIFILMPVMLFSARLDSIPDKIAVDLIEAMEVIKVLQSAKEQWNIDSLLLAQKLSNCNDGLAGVGASINDVKQEEERLLAVQGGLNKRIEKLVKDSLKLVKLQIKKKEDNDAARLLRNKLTKAEAAAEKAGENMRNLTAANNRINDLNLQINAKNTELKELNNRNRIQKEETIELRSKLTELEADLTDFKAKRKADLEVMELEIKDYFKTKSDLASSEELELFRKRIAKLNKYIGQDFASRLSDVKRDLDSYEEVAKVFREARNVLAQNYDERAVNSSKSSLLAANVSNYSTSLQNLKAERISLLDNYKQEYCKLFELFNNFNKLSTESIVLKYIDKYALPGEEDYVDAAYEFIHNQLERRRLNPLRREQPFNGTTCPKN